MYVKFDFYSETYQGRADEKTFDRLKLKAMSLIDYYTFGRVVVLDADNFNLNMAMSELIDYLYKAEQTNGREITSETVGTWSRAYTAEDRTDQQQMREIISRHLGHTGLMYRGVR